MSRLPMPSAMPAELAERMSDVAGPEVTDRDRRDARLEIIDEVLEGDGHGRHDFFAVLQEYLNVDGVEYDQRLQLLAAHFQNALFGNPRDADVPRADRLMLARMDAESWAKSLVEESITEDMIEERAAEIADERREDADAY